ncbi:MAG: hypothetical protein IPO58_24525 [Betaproteobacteria bacterium]|nr:hypothetical protein [Betaproteobacteria bacterium]
MKFGRSGPNNATRVAEWMPSAPTSQSAVATLPSCSRAATPSARVSSPASA